MQEQNCTVNGLVWFSASDAAQHEWYLAQLQLKLDLGDLPLGRSFYQIFKNINKSECV